LPTGQSEPFLPYGRQSIDDDDIAAVVEVLRSDWLTSGPKVAAFEDALSKQLAVPETVVCANGTAALWLAYATLRETPAGRVVVPAITFVATANAALMAGYDVCFADVDPNTGMITPETAAAALTNHPDARTISLVHMGGHVVDVAMFADLLETNDHIIIEDACHAIGGTYPDASGPVGLHPLSTAATYSFHPVKTVTMGEGGAIATRDSDRAKTMRLLRSHGLAEDSSEISAPHESHISPRAQYILGTNMRASDLQCALGIHQLGKLDGFVSRRKTLAARYDDQIAKLSPAVVPVDRPQSGQSGWHLYVVLIDFEQIGMTRAAFMKALADLGIGTQVHYRPVPYEPYFRSKDPSNSRYPGAERYAGRCLSLPLFPDMADTDVDRVVEGLSTVLGT
jgi:dTDP-4-amino-4,6-dideoxygalactose transaminase